MLEKKAVNAKVVLLNEITEYVFGWASEASVILLLGVIAKNDVRLCVCVCVCVCPHDNGQTHGPILMKFGTYVFWNDSLDKFFNGQNQTSRFEVTHNIFWMAEYILILIAPREGH